MLTEAHALFESKPWKARIGKLGFGVKITGAECPYNEETGTLYMEFDDPNSTRVRRYQWESDPTMFRQHVDISMMPEGCGMLVLSNLWMFDRNNPERDPCGKFIMDFVVDLAKYMSNAPESKVVGARWGRVLLATTSSNQKKMGTYLRTSGWTKIHTTNNPRSGNKMHLWMLDLAGAEYVSLDIEGKDDEYL